MTFVDTDVMVDLLRTYPPAVKWLESLGEEELLLSGFVCAELVQGCTTKEQQDKVARFLLPHHTTWPERETCDRALRVFSDFHLSHGLGLIDALIGQMAADMNVPLNTFNTRHYECIPGLKTEQPYLRRGV